MFKWLFGRLGGAADNHDRWLPVLDESLATVLAQSKPAVQLSFTPGEAVPEGPVSSIGGRPSLPSADAWPRDAAGNAMTFLAQINYADMPRLEGYPTAGLLSFFACDDDLFGCDFPSKDGKGFAVLWVEDPSGLARVDQPEMKEGYSPFGPELEKHGAPLTGVLGEGPPMPGSAIAERLVPDWPEGFPVDLEDAFADRLMDEKPSTIYYGAHPDFTQSDFRYGDNAVYTEVLLQIGMVTPDTHGWQVMFGDAGEAQFMISPEDLAAQAFGNAVWNWDCC